jgi:methylated-DNA-[protein]-cysteine S-methyltransferase
MEQIKIQYLKTKAGELMLGAYDNQLCLCDWRHRKMRNAIDGRLQRLLNASYTEEGSEVVELATAQLHEYLAGERTTFDVPLLLAGTDFQKTVWQALLQVPYGSVQTYADLSRTISNTLAVRAVASANGANAISIFIPCHRIIGSNGQLVGYAGGLEAKKQLLELEASHSKQLSLF